jgi:hypothetical protein
MYIGLIVKIHFLEKKIFFLPCWDYLGRAANGGKQDAEA